MRYILITIMALLVVGGAVLAQDVPDGTTISLGDEINAELTNDAPRAFYSFRATAGTEIAVTLSSVDFDAYLVLFDSEDMLLTEDDDSAGRLNAVIEYVIEETGIYTILVTSAREYNSEGTFAPIGDYTLSLEGEQAAIFGGGESTEEPPNEEAEGPTDEAEIAQPQGDLRYGDSVEGQLTRLDPFVEYTFTAAEGDVIEILMTSSDFDTYLLLQDADGLLLTEDDDGGGGTDSSIGPFTIPEAGLYTIVAQSWSYIYGDGAGTGSFTLMLDTIQIETVESNEEISGSIGPENISDVYYIDAEAGDLLAISIETDNFSVFVTLDDEDGNYIRETYGGSDILGPISASRAQRYVLSVSSYDTSITYDYRVTIQTLEPATIDLNTPLTDQIDDSGPAAYVFEGDAEQIINVTVDGELDTILTLTDPDGFEARYDDDGGAGLNPEISNYALPFSGEYMVTIWPFIPGDEGEFTMTIETAPLLSLDDGPQSIRLGEKQAINAVTFEGSAGESVLLSARLLTENSGDVALVVTQDGETLANITIGQVERIIIEVLPTSDGPIQVTVEDFFGFSTVVELELVELAEN